MTTLHETWYNVREGKSEHVFKASADTCYPAEALDACERAREHENQKGFRAFAGAK